MLQRTEQGYAKGVSVRALRERYNLTDLRTYQHQARHAINMQRMTAAGSTRAWPYPRNGQPSANSTLPVATAAAAAPGEAAAEGTAVVGDVGTAEAVQGTDLRRAVGIVSRPSTEAERRAVVPVECFVRAHGALAGRHGPARGQQLQSLLR